MALTHKTGHQEGIEDSQGASSSLIQHQEGSKIIISRFSPSIDYTVTVQERKKSIKESQVIGQLYWSGELLKSG